MRKKKETKMAETVGTVTHKFYVYHALVENSVKISNNITR